MNFISTFDSETSLHWGETMCIQQQYTYVHCLKEQFTCTFYNVRGCCTHVHRCDRHVRRCGRLMNGNMHIVDSVDSSSYSNIPPVSKYRNCCAIVLKCQDIIQSNFGHHCEGKKHPDYCPKHRKPTAGCIGMRLQNPCTHVPSVCLYKARALLRQEENLICFPQRGVINKLPGKQIGCCRPVTQRRVQKTFKQTQLYDED